ncbi:hypothetical protein ACH4YO_30515 [Streptomyces noursei]|uniref:hypothetical protein n=1 Tax=Streptomyces noursei TaxID=1971 RepID=UPI0008322C61
MMRLFHPITIGLGSIVLALALPAGTALAATGKFGWVGPKGRPYFIQNPPNSKCLTMSQEARAPHNSTKQTVAVYSGKHCDGRVTRLAPGKSAPSGTHFSSVVFNPR